MIENFMEKCAFVTKINIGEQLTLSFFWYYGIKARKKQ